MNPLLIVLNPRDIPECMDSLRALDIDKAWMTAMTERQLVPHFAELVASTTYSHYLVIADDAIVRQASLDAVLALADDHPVVTGWSNLDCEEAHVNLQRTPLVYETPNPTVWNLYHFAEVMGHADQAVPTYFGGMCLTGMSRELWQRFPFDCYGEPGAGSDYHLAWRLQQADVPIVAARDGFVFHVKERWGKGDIATGKRLLIGKIEPKVTLEAR